MKADTFIHVMTPPKMDLFIEDACIDSPFQIVSLKSDRAEIKVKFIFLTHVKHTTFFRELKGGSEHQKQKKTIASVKQHDTEFNPHSIQWFLSRPRQYPPFQLFAHSIASLILSPPHSMLFFILTAALNFRFGFSACFFFFFSFLSFLSPFCR